MGGPAPTTVTIDLNANAVDIACRLSSLRYFLEAVEELQTCKNMASTTFRRYSRKVHNLHGSFIRAALTTCHAQIISLIEVISLPFKIYQFNLLNFYFWTARLPAELLQQQEYRSTRFALVLHT